MLVGDAVPATRRVDREGFASPGGVSPARVPVVAQHNTTPGAHGVFRARRRTRATTKVLRRGASIGCGCPSFSWPKLSRSRWQAGWLESLGISCARGRDSFPPGHRCAPCGTRYPTASAVFAPRHRIRRTKPGSLSRGVSLGRRSSPGPAGDVGGGHVALVEPASGAPRRSASAATMDNGEFAPRVARCVLVGPGAPSRFTPGRCNHDESTSTSPGYSQDRHASRGRGARNGPPYARAGSPCGSPGCRCRLLPRPLAKRPLPLS